VICSAVNLSQPETLCTHVIYENGDNLLSDYQTDTLDEVARFLQAVSQ